MAEWGQAGTNPEIALHLLDSSQGHPIQTWRFAGSTDIAIGRDESSDIVITDPHVSRTHVRLKLQNGRWVLVSLGRHGTLIDDRLVTEVQLEDRSMFRLGPHGPLMRFDLGKTQANTVTMDTIDPDMFAMLEVDEQRKLAEVEQITAGELFEDLMQQSRQFKAMRRDEAGPSL
jgi:pSer/pThr/pTyr-binding forkhead associated (FHA) protein